jgi:hypothetical protein
MTSRDNSFSELKLPRILSSCEVLDKRKTESFCYEEQDRLGELKSFRKEETETETEDSLIDWSLNLDFDTILN